MPTTSADTAVRHPVANYSAHCNRGGHTMMSSLLVQDHMYSGSFSSPL